MSCSIFLQTIETATISMDCALVTKYKQQTRHRSYLEHPMSAGVIMEFHFEWSANSKNQVGRTDLYHFTTRFWSPILSDRQSQRRKEISPRPRTLFQGLLRHALWPGGLEDLGWKDWVKDRLLLDWRDCGRETESFLNTLSLFSYFSVQYMELFWTRIDVRRYCNSTLIHFWISMI